MPLPIDLLDVLHERHPYAQLCVSSSDLDHPLVSSSQLYRLAISVPYSDDVNPASVAPFEQLRRVLLQSHTLRELSIDVHQDARLGEPSHVGTDATGLNAHEDNDGLSPTKAVNLVQIPLNDEDRLPPLEVLIIKAQEYSLDREHCERLYVSSRSDSEHLLGNFGADTFLPLVSNAWTGAN